MPALTRQVPEQRRWPSASGEPFAEGGAGNGRGEGDMYLGGTGETGLFRLGARVIGLGAGAGGYTANADGYGNSRQRSVEAVLCLF